MVAPVSTEDSFKLTCMGYKITYQMYDGDGCTGNPSSDASYSGWVSSREYQKLMAGQCAQWAPSTHTGVENIMSERTAMAWAAEDKLVCATASSAP